LPAANAEVRLTGILLFDAAQHSGVRIADVPARVAKALETRPRHLRRRHTGMTI
jgi:hypothetical protein